MNMKQLKPAIVDGSVVKDYFVCPEGNVWSCKRVNWRKLSPTVSGKSAYPKVKLSILGKMKTLYSHRVACESFHKFPTPEGVTKAEWKITPDKVKRLLGSLYQVNHIDHDHANFHPSNLEWVTVKQNSGKYQEHRTK